MPGLGRRSFFAGFAAIALLLAVVAPAAATSQGALTTYVLAGADGGVFTFATGHFHGSLGARSIPHPIVAVLPARSGSGSDDGYLLVSSAGVVYPFGKDTRSYGDLRGTRVPSPIVAAAGVGSGYMFTTAEGRVYTFGGSQFYGDLSGRKLAHPIVGIASNSGHYRSDGYLLVDSAGKVYPFGAGWFGDLSQKKLDVPIVGLDSVWHTRDGYWLVDAAGKVYPFGSAPRWGDMSGHQLSAPAAGILSLPWGYYIFAKDGGVFTFGDLLFRGSMGSRHMNAPVVGMTFQFE
jgi:hypothetical protein